MSRLQAIDTNLLVRLFVNDDAAQAAKVKALFDRHADEDEAFWIADIVLVELVWTLGRLYRRSRPEILVALRALADNATVRLESAAAVVQAAELFEQGPADFADCLLVVKATHARCAQVRTFDRTMRGLPGVKLV